jgi:hypothetical protein
MKLYHSLHELFPCNVVFARRLWSFYILNDSGFVFGSFVFSLNILGRKRCVKHAK